MGGACDCEEFCKDLTLPLGVLWREPFWDDARCASDCSWLAAASASGRTRSLEGGAWELRLLRCGVPLVDRRFERRDAGDDDMLRSVMLRIYYKVAVGGMKSGKKAESLERKLR